MNLYRVIECKNGMYCVQVRKRSLLGNLWWKNIYTSSFLESAREVFASYVYAKQRKAEEASKWDAVKTIEEKEAE